MILFARNVKMRFAVFLERLGRHMDDAAIRLSYRIPVKSRMLPILMFLGVLVVSLSGLSDIGHQQSGWAWFLSGLMIVVGVLLAVFGTYLWIMPVCHFSPDKTDDKKSLDK